ncbi:MAG: hypothetical protein JXA89_07570 [Anaerolineae bacterium]|nr:hypothetical protein [Anaerolineae bacterium]
MFRRQPPRRLARRRPGGGPLEVKVIQALRRAHRLMENGQVAQAFPIFKRLADGAAQRGMPLKAAPLYFQAARARLEMGSAQDAVELARRAIQLLAQAGQIERIRTVLPRLIKALEEKGFYSEAVLLRAEAAALLGAEDKADLPFSQRGILPAKCPSCNGPVRSDEVDWVDENSAECVYCGSVIQTE